jgi:phage I-like protein
MISAYPSSQLVLLDDSVVDRDLFALNAEIELIQLANGETALPREIRILKNGVNETTKGPINCDAAAAKATVAAVVAHYGKPVLNFDYGHGQVGFVGSYESARSAGWFRIEERNGDLYAADIEWTPNAAKALKDREFRYFSPALMRDYESGKVKSMINVALTNIPATKGQAPIVASQNEPTKGPRMDPELKKLLDRLGLTSLDQLSGKIDTLSSSEATLLAAVKEGQTALAAVTARLTAIEGQSSAKAKADFITKLSTDGKLPPALHKWAASQDMASLEAFAADAPVIAAVDPKADITPKPKAVPTTLSDDEKKLCHAMMLSEADYLATRAVLLSSANPWAYDPLTAAEPVKGSK